MITFPLWFKIFLGSGFFTIILISYNLLTKDKFIANIKELHDGEIENKMVRNLRIVKALKLFFYATPVYLILLPYLFYIYNPEELLHYLVLIIITYVVTIEDFLFRKSIVLEFKQNK